MTCAPCCSHEDIAWAAGLFEGEGTFGVNTKRAGGRQYLGPYASLSLHIRDADVLERFHRVVGVGEIRHHGTPTMRKWGTGKMADVACLARLFYPSLGARRREQADKVLALIASKEGHTA